MLNKTQLFLLASIVMLFSACQDKKPAIKIGMIKMIHESCTFSPDTAYLEDWEFYGKPKPWNPKADNGFRRICEEFGGIEIVGITSPQRVGGGSSKGWIPQDVFDKYCGLMIADIKKAGKLDGLYLKLHGAMAVIGVPKPEAELVRRLREHIGDIPVVISLDLHANVDKELSDVADAILIIKRYPHYDYRLIEERCARIMIGTIKGNYKPILITKKPGIITPSVMQGTGVSPAKDIMERARRWECRYADVYVSVAFGYAYADVPDIGATIMVVCNNNKKLAEEIAADMNEYIWRNREVFAGRKLPNEKDGAAQAIAAANEGKTPVIIADHSDRTGGSTHILEQLIKQGAKNFCIATLREEKAIRILKDNHKIGDEVSIEIGGYSDRFAGNPVLVNGKISFIGTYKKDSTIVISMADNNHIILTSNLMQITDTMIYAPVGIDFKTLDIVSLKTRVHFRRGYHETGVAGTILEIDPPGLGAADVSKLPYKFIPDNLYPIVK